MCRSKVLCGCFLFLIREREEIREGRRERVRREKQRQRERERKRKRDITTQLCNKQSTLHVTAYALAPHNELPTKLNINKHNISISWITQSTRHPYMHIMAYWRARFPGCVIAMQYIYSTISIRIVCCFCKKSNKKSSLSAETMTIKDERHKWHSSFTIT